METQGKSTTAKAKKTSEGEERESKRKEGLCLPFPWDTTHLRETYQGLSVHVVSGGR